ncbi:hypothetical protein NC652_036604 [Populus alba x Populus x berolinensis]|nr:hypothetical protein NC652_036604 [Populus alba x Populus x berolinensis]
MVLQFIFTVLAVSEHSLEIHKTVVSSNRGAMVLADLGHCCIGEFDKMSAEHQALLEALEQQCVSVAKLVSWQVYQHELLF